MSTDKHVGRLMEMMRRQDRFTFDLRSECRIYFGIVGAYRATPEDDHFADLSTVIAHAWERDGIVSGWRDPADGKAYYDSCRVFTDLDHAIRFAREEGQGSVYNLNRGMEIRVDDDEPHGGGASRPQGTVLPAVMGR